MKSRNRITLAVGFPVLLVSVITAAGGQIAFTVQQAGSALRLLYRNENDLTILWQQRFMTLSSLSRPNA